MFKVLDILQYLGLLPGPTWMGPEKFFRIKVIRRLENTILKLVSPDTLFHKKTILLIFYLEFKVSVLGILLYPESTKGPTMVGLKEKLSN